jgi:outer membrane protein assembly factor BamB
MDVHDGRASQPADRCLIKVDRNTGGVVKTATYQRGAAEPIVDGNNLIRVGWMAFTGVTFAGGYDRFDANLTFLGGPGGYTTSRAALLPDTSSSVRLGYVFDSSAFVSARGANTWDVSLSQPERLNTVPSADSQGTIFVGTTRGVVAVRPTDGSVRWSLDLGQEITTQPVIVGGILYVASSSGTLFALEDPCLRGCL